MVVTLAATVACSSGGGSGTGSTPASPPTAAASTSGKALLTIPNRSASSKARQPQFISASAVSVGIAVNGAAPTFADVSTTSTLCTAAGAGRTCAIPISAPPGTAIFAITLYDAANGGGNALGTGTASQVVVSGTPFTLAVAVNGIVASVALSVSPATLPAGKAGTATISVTAKDVDGNTIIAPGNYTTPIVLTNSDTSGSTSISPASLAAPGQTATLSYTGALAAGSSATVGAQVAGIPSNAITSTVVTIATATPTPTPTSTSTSTTQSCGATATLPGTYTTIISVGSVSGTTYTASTAGNVSSWYTFNYTASTPSPAPSATTTSPSPAPSATARTPQPVFLYLGTYQLKSGTTGCFFTTITQDGSPLTIYNGTNNQGSSGIGTGSPNLPANTAQAFVTFGSISSLVISNLSPTGGTGTVSLSNGDSGTITLSTRIASTLDDARKLTAQMRRQ